MGKRKSMRVFLTLINNGVAELEVLKPDYSSKVTFEPPRFDLRGLGGLGGWEGFP